MLLAQDSFAPLPAAIAEGRRIYDNLSKCVKYYLACKLALVASCLVCELAGLGLPFSPVQIIILELFMDLAASTSFVTERAEPDLAHRRLRPRDESFMNKAMLSGIFGGGASLALAVLAVFVGSLHFGADQVVAQTRAFVAWLAGHVALAFAMRTTVVPLRETGILASRPFNLWALGVALFLAISLSVPALRDYLKLAPIGVAATLCIAAFAAMSVSWIEIAKRLRWRRLPHRDRARQQLN
jgi:Cation transport ATPase